MLDFKLVLSSATVVLCGGLAFLGCSEGGRTLLPASDDVPASSLFENDLWVDGGGFSPNDRDLETFGVEWSCPALTSDGADASDRSAVVWFVCRDPVSLQRSLFLAHYDGNTLTPPVQMVGEDQDLQPGTTVQIQRPVAFPLGTAAYPGADGVAARVRQNARAWVVLFLGQTWTRHPDDLLTQAGPTGRVGRRRTLYSTVFLPAWRGQAEARATGVIGDATDTVVLRQGWQMPAVELVLPGNRAGGAVDTLSDPASRAAVMLPCDVASFGLASDGLTGQSDWGRQATGAPLGGTSGGAFGGSDYTRAGPVNGAPGDAIYQAGESTTFLHLFYTQMLNSLGGGGSVARDVTAGYAAGGARQAGFTASFDLARLRWESPIELNPPAARNPGGTAPTSGGTGLYAEFHTYEQHVFYSYADASLITGPGADPLGLVPASAAYAYDNVGGHDGFILHATAFHEELCAAFAVQDDGDGTSSVIPGSNHDLATHTQAPGLHDLVNPSSSGGGVLDTAPNREIQAYPFRGPFIYGRDQGLAETVVFFVGADNTRAGGIDAAQQSIVRQGLAAALDARGELIGGAPVVWSRHRPSHHDRYLTGVPGAGPEDVKQDPLVAFGAQNGGDGDSDARANVMNDEGHVFTPPQLGLTSYTLYPPIYFRADLNRTGQWVLLSYLQDEGTSLAFHRALKAVCYQAPRAGEPTPALEQRFTLPLEISATGASVSITQDPAAQTGTQNAETQHRWDALPVSEVAVPDEYGYRGRQSEPNVLTLLWEQSDATGDRAFLRDLTVSLGATGQPSAPTLGAIVELEAGPQAQVAAHRNDVNDVYSSANELAKSRCGKGRAATGRRSDPGSRCPSWLACAGLIAHESARTRIRAFLALCMKIPLALPDRDALVAVRLDALDRLRVDVERVRRLRLDKNPTALWLPRGVALHTGEPGVRDLRQRGRRNARFH